MAEPEGFSQHSRLCRSQCCQRLAKSNGTFQVFPDAPKSHRAQSDGGVDVSSASPVDLSRNATGAIRAWISSIGQ